MRRTADRRTDFEDGDGTDEAPLRWIDPQELAEPEDESRLRKDEARRDPALLVERVEVAGDSRQRGREDRLVEGDEEDGQENGAEHDGEFLCSGRERQRSSQRKRRT